MSQNKIATLVWGLCPGNYWERYWFTMIMFILKLNPYEHIFCTLLRFSVCFPVRSHFASLQGIYYFLLLLSNGSMSQMLLTTLYFNTSFFRPHTSAPVLLIVTSFQISKFIISRVDRKRRGCPALNIYPHRTSLS